MCAIEIQPVVTTERLVLRRPRLSDAKRIAELANDHEVARMMSSMPWPYALSDAEAFLAAQDAKPGRDFVIEHPAEGVVGVAGFKFDALGRAELGYWLGRPYWGCGFATEAARGALVWASRDWKKRAIIARHFTDNPASGEVLCKAGFLYTGEVTLTPSPARPEPAPCRTMVWLA
jgi:RimJ/RimL family protein N-acetyltransferase